MMQNSKEKSLSPQLTIIENEGPRLFVPPEPKTPNDPAQPFGFATPTANPFGTSPLQPTATQTTGTRISPGDDANPNNYLPLSFANSFACPVSIALGSKRTFSKQHTLPKSISLTTTLANNGSDGYHVLHDLRVSFHNNLQDTAAALLSMPRLPNVLLLEEEHECSGIKYKPKVEEKELAQLQYQQAASSQNKTATLAEIGSDAHHIKLDKVPAGADGVFVVRFLQAGGLKVRGEVSRSAEESKNNNDSDKWTKRSIADIAILPGFTCLDCPEGGVPFDYTLCFENEDAPSADQYLRVELPEAEVMAKDVEDAAEGYGSKNRNRKDIFSILQLDPSLVTEKKDSDNRVVSTLSWKSLSGLARGTLLKIRLIQTQNDKHSFRFGDDSTLAKSFSPIQPLSDMIRNVDSIPGIMHDTQNGIKCDSSLVDLEIPMTLPASLTCPSTQQHELYIIIDTSGSTSMRSGEGGQTFLETAKSLLDGILLDLPARIRHLKSTSAIHNGTLPISVKLWSFDNDTKYEAEAKIEPSKGAASVIEPLRARVSQMRPGGCTNYDSWAAKLRSMVSANPSHLYSVLLITDGGATSRQQFFKTIDSISSFVLSSGGFFQVDSLGYGPWLDPVCVSYLSARTGGEALMVESLSGSGTREKIFSILAKSLVRAASKLSLCIENAKLLAMSNGGGEVGDDDEGNCSSSIQAMFPSPSLRVRVYPGQKLRLVLLHPSNSAPQIKLHAGDEGIFSVVPYRQTEGWETVLPSTPQAAKKVPLCHPNALQALRHLPMLEPAYARPGSVHHPPSTASDRTIVTLKTSILGQIVAPSVTKSIAVVELDSNSLLEPVPEHCRPDPVPLKELYSTNVRFEGEKDNAFSLFGSGQLAFNSLAPGFGSPAPAPVPRSSFGVPAPTTTGANPFGAPAPSPAFGGTDQHTNSPGFKVTKPSFGEKKIVPDILDWVHTTRGGIYLADAKRLNENKQDGKRLTKEILRDYSMNYASLPNAYLLRAIECTISLFPNKTGSLASFEEWATKYKDDTSALTSVALVCKDVVSADGLAVASSFVFPWQTIGANYNKDIVWSKANTESEKELADRMVFLSVMTATVRRDIYNILVNPNHPNKGAEPSSRGGDGSIPFSAALIAKASNGKGVDEFAFVDKERVVGSLDDEYRVLNGSDIIDAISNMGGARPCALAVLKAFEEYLKGKAKNWTDEDTSLLSVEFLVAFGREMTPRLDVHHHLRSKKLSKDEILTLRSEPFSLYVDQGMLKAFQDIDNPTWTTK